jgi:type VI secretion system Hcp family effector
MPDYCLLYVDGIPGDCEIQGYEDHSLVFEVDHQIGQQFSPETGAPTGGCVHGTLNVTKWIDSMSPGLSKSLCTSCNIPEVRLLYLRPPTEPGVFGHHNFYIITLHSARVAELRPYVPLSFKRSNEFEKPCEKVSFTYYSVTYCSLDGSTECTMEWCGGE